MIAAGCTDLSKYNPYGNDVHRISVKVTTSGNTGAGGAAVEIESITNGSKFSMTADENGVAVFMLVNGLYRARVSYTEGSDLYNGSEDRIRLSGKDTEITMTLAKVRTSSIVIKEIYCGGCKKTPQEGDYQADKYIILHNNSAVTEYLDGLCFGTLSPYNATATNPWTGKDGNGNITLPEFVPVVEAVWQFPGDGDDFPLESGKDAVIAVNGAIDHSTQYPLSVNLNNPDYFVCYNTVYFPNTTYHPAPGSLIRQDRIMEVVIKTGQSNAYPLSISSPAVVIFKSEGMTIQEFIAEKDNVIQIPGAVNAGRVTCIPQEWILDAVEVFDGESSNNLKRLLSSLDSGYIVQSGTYLGHSLVRRVNETASAEAGYEILVDTNNSTNDFFESEKAMLHDDGEGADNE